MTKEQLEAITKEIKLNSIAQLCKDLKNAIEEEQENEDLSFDSPEYQYLKGQEDLLDILINFIDK